METGLIRPMQNLRHTPDWQDYPPTGQAYGAAKYAELCDSIDKAGKCLGGHFGATAASSHHCCVTDVTGIAVTVAFAP